MSTTLSKNPDKSLSGWNEAIAEAKEKIKELKNSIRTFESLRDEGMKFPNVRRRGKSERATGSTS
jgi:hypothetical protein